MTVDFLARAGFIGDTLDNLEVWVHRLDEAIGLPYSMWIEESLRNFDLLELLTGSSAVFEDEEHHQFLFKGRLTGRGEGEDYDEDVEIDKESIEQAKMPDDYYSDGGDRIG